MISCIGKKTKTNVENSAIPKQDQSLKSSKKSKVTVESHSNLKKLSKEQALILAYGNSSPHFLGKNSSNEPSEYTYEVMLDEDYVGENVRYHILVTRYGENDPPWWAFSDGSGEEPKAQMTRGGEISLWRYTDNSLELKVKRAKIEYANIYQLEKIGVNNFVLIAKEPNHPGGTGLVPGEDTYFYSIAKDRFTLIFQLSTSEGGTVDSETQQEELLGGCDYKFISESQKTFYDLKTDCWKSDVKARSEILYEFDGEVYRKSSKNLRNF